MAALDDQHVLKVAEIDDNFLTCEICLDRFKRAKNLPCGHTFCQECLEKWAEENRGRELTCPYCRKLWQVPNGGIENLPANYHLNNLVDFVLASQSVETVSGTQPCEFCEIQDAAWACVECRQIACNSCRKVHGRTKTTANHQFVDLEEYRTNHEFKIRSPKRVTYENQPALPERLNRANPEPKPLDLDQQHPGNIVISMVNSAKAGDYVRNINSLEEQRWYHGKLSRKEAEDILETCKEGSYLVRDRESVNWENFALSLKSPGGYRHMKIVYKERSGFVLGGFSQPFENVSKMIDFYARNNLIFAGKEKIMLLYPVGREIPIYI